MTMVSFSYQTGWTRGALKYEIVNSGKILRSVFNVVLNSLPGCHLRTVSRELRYNGSPVINGLLRPPSMASSDEIRTASNWTLSN